MKLHPIFTFSVILAALLPQAWALVGGPWDHLNSSAYSSRNPDGLYQASVTMKNGSGYVKFTQDSDLSVLEASTTSETSQTTSSLLSESTTTIELSDSLAQNSNSIIYYKGQTYFGNTYGMVDLGSKTVSGTTSGTSAQAEDLTASLSEFADSSEAVLDFSDIIDSFNMAFEGKVTETRPQIRFEAKGTIEFYSRPPISVEIVVGDLSGLTLSTGSSGTLDLDLEDLVTKVISTDGDFVSQGSVDIRLFGYRSSVTPDDGTLDDGT